MSLVCPQLSGTLLFSHRQFFFSCMVKQRIEDEKFQMERFKCFHCLFWEILGFEEYCGGSFVCLDVFGPIVLSKPLEECCISADGIWLIQRFICSTPSVSACLELCVCVHTHVSVFTQSYRWRRSDLKSIDLVAMETTRK